MSTNDVELGKVRKGFHICREELADSRFEVRRLRALIRRTVADLEDMKIDPGFIESIDNEARQLVQCQCGKLHGHDQLAWRDWSDVNLQVTECPICNSTLSRTYVR